MSDSVEISREADDALTRQVWRFFRLGNRLVLDGYEEEARDSKRHKFKRVQFWKRLYERDSRLKIGDVPMTPELKAEALEAFFTQLRAVLTVEI